MYLQQVPSVGSKKPVFDGIEHWHSILEFCLSNVALFVAIINGHCLLYKKQQVLFCVIRIGSCCHIDLRMFTGVCNFCHWSLNKITLCIVKSYLDVLCQHERPFNVPVLCTNTEESLIR